MDNREVVARGIRFSETSEGVEIGRAYLYVLQNDSPRVFGLLEDVYVDELARTSGVGRRLVEAVIARARKEGCYKLIATSRDDGTRQTVHAWYLRIGFRDYGKEFRMDLH